MGNPRALFLFVFTLVFLCILPWKKDSKRPHSDDFDPNEEEIDDMNQFYCSEMTRGMIAHKALGIEDLACKQ